MLAVVSARMLIVPVGAMEVRNRVAHPQPLPLVPAPLPGGIDATKPGELAGGLQVGGLDGHHRLLRQPNGPLGVVGDAEADQHLGEANDPEADLPRAAAGPAPYGHS